MKQTSLRLSFLFVLGVLYTTLSTPAVSAQALSASVQPDSPLTVGDLSHDWKPSEDGHWHMLELAFALKNRGTKAVRAYAINFTEGDPHAKIGNLYFSHMTSPTSFIRPGQTRREEIDGHGYSRLPPVVTLAVDFVEFADGSTWGADLHKSADFLAGRRACGRSIKTTA